MSHCPCDEQLLLLLSESLEEDDREAVEEHVETCADCQGRLARLVGDVTPPGSHTTPYLARLKNGLAARTTPAEPPAAPAPGGPPAVPGYEVLGELGRGGMGVVYKARQEGFNREVALKMILAGSHAGPEERARFLAEAEAIAAVKHPGIVAVYDFGTHAGLPYFSMEFCPGGSLGGRLAGTPMAPQEAASVVERVARAMQAAHQADVIHRDLKPGNVLLGEDGAPKVTDFGLAKRVEAGPGLTQTGAIMGTPSYMAPEQARGGKEVGPAADIYALGAILYECLTGRPPFKAATAVDTVLLVLSEEPAPPRQLNSRLPVDLETICLKCLRKEPAERYPSALELAEDLRRWQTGEPILARPVGPVRRALKWARRHPARAALACTALLALALAGLSLYQRARVLERRLQLRNEAADLWNAAADEEAKGRVARAGKQDARAAQHLDAARVGMERALATLRASPEGADGGLREQIASRLRGVEEEIRGLAIVRQAEEEKRRFQGLLAQLEKDTEELLFRDLSDANLAGNRQAVTRLAPRAVAPFGIDPTRPPHEAGRALAPLAPLFADAQQRRRVAGWCCEVLLIWAESEAADARGRPPGEERQSGLRRALGLLETAEALVGGEKVPAPRALLERRAACLEALGQEAAARAARRRAERVPRATALDHFLLARECHRRGAGGEAADACDRALELQPGYFWAQYLRGLVHLRAGEWAVANAWLTACLGPRPASFWAAVMRAVARVECGKLDGAAADLAVALREADSPEKRYLTRVTLGRLAMAKQRWREAGDELLAAVRDEPAGSHEAHVNLAQVYRRLKDPRAAVAELDVAVARRPGDARLYYTRAQARRECGDVAAARRDFAAAIERRPAGCKERWLASAYVELGYLKHQAGEHAAALADFDAALGVVEGYAHAHRQRAETLLALGRHVEAGRALDAYLEGGGRPEAAVFKARGLIHAALREHAQAALAFSRSLRLSPEADVLAYRGWAHLQSRSLGPAQADFDAALASDPHQTDALCGRGLLRALSGSVKAALEDAQAALEHGKPTPALLCNAACIHAQAARRSREAAGGRTVPAGASPGRLEDQAAGLIAQALRLVPAAGRGRFWQEQIERDPTLRSLGRHPEMMRLASRYRPR